MRGLSTILAIIMMVIIVISVVGLFYTFSASLTRTAMSTTESTLNTTTTTMLTQMNVLSMSFNDVLIKNTGLNDISASSIKVYVNNNPANFSLTPPVLKPNEIGTVKIYDFIKKNDDISIGTGSVFTDEKAPDPCNDAVLCLNFDESSGVNAYDSSGNGNNGVFNGETFSDGTLYGATRVDGKYGKSLSFDGINKYVDFGDTVNLNTTSLTVMMWLNLASNPNCDELNNWRSLIKKGTTAGTATGWSILLEEGRNLRFDIGNGTSWQNRLLSPNETVPINEWVHLAFTYDRITGNQSIYKNGILNVSRLVTVGYMKIDSNHTQLSHGDNTSACPNQAGYINGTIDEVRIWNRSLTQAEIQDEMQSSMPTSRTVASYSFEESGNYANETHIWIKGKYGSALSFDGINDYTSSPTSNSLNFEIDSFTVTFWFKPLALPASYSGVINKEWLPGWLVTWRPSQQMMIRWGNSSASSDYVDVWSDATKPLSLDNWHYVIFVVNRNTQKTYLVIDSVKHLPEQDCSAIGNVSNENDFAIGYENAYFFNGLIDEVRIYNRAIY